MSVGNRVVITGLGVVSPVGNDIDTFWKNSVAGVSGIHPIERFDTTPFRCVVAGQVSGLEQSPFYRKNYASIDPCSAMALVAAGQALGQAGIEMENTRKTCFGTYVGTGVGGVFTHEATCMKYYEQKDNPRISPLVIVRVMNNSSAHEIATRYGFAGESLTISTACAAGLQAIGEAVRAVRYGRLDLAVAGGTDAPLSRPLYSAWHCMRVLSSWDGESGAASRPFSEDRSGLVLAEGAAFVVLESERHAVERGAEIIGHVDGYASNTCHEHVTRPSMEPQVDVMDDAIKDAVITTEEVDYIHAHGTGTPANDVVETEAIKAVFRERAAGIPVSSGKSMLGHTLGASGAFGMISSLLTLKHGIATPTINLDKPDPRCDLNNVPNRSQRLARSRYALANSFGFGGTNTSVVVSKA
jgi:3-oxoacyl-[acyl-carrier-protein] synthase II